MFVISHNKDSKFYNFLAEAIARTCSALRWSSYRCQTWTRPSAVMTVNQKCSRVARPDIQNEHHEQWKHLNGRTKGECRIWWFHELIRCMQRTAYLTRSYCINMLYSEDQGVVPMEKEHSDEMKQIDVLNFTLDEAFCSSKSR
jgi:hypothetical protein